MADMTYADWQVNRSVLECNKYMLDNQVDCDLGFLLQSPDGDQRVSAHKFVLVSRSPVFFAMLCGPIAERNREIRIPDISRDAFWELLRYIYYEEAVITEDNVYPILYAAKKYMIHSLSNHCLDFLSNNVSTENVCVLLENSFLFEESVDLPKKCLELVQKQTKKVLTSDAFYDISCETLCRMLRTEKLSAHEVDVFRACVHWSERKCAELGMAVTAPNQRKVLGQALYYIHIPTITLNEFTKIVVPTGLLNVDEENVLFRYLSSDKKEESVALPFPKLSREYVAVRCDVTYERFVRHTTAYSALFQGVPQRSRWVMTFHCDHSLRIQEIGFLGSFKGAVNVVQHGNRKLEITCHAHIKVIKLEEELILDAGPFSISTDAPFSFSGEYVSKSVTNPLPGVLLDQDKVQLVVKDCTSLCFISHLIFVPTDEIHFIENYYSDEHEADEVEPEDAQVVEEH